VIDLATIKHPTPTTADQKLAMIGQIWKLPPASPQGSPGAMTSLDVNVSNGGFAEIISASLIADAELYFGGAEDVYFYPNEGGYPNMGFADFAIHPANSQEPNIQITTSAYMANTTFTALADCMVAGWNTETPPVFQFDQSSNGWFGPWTNTAVVTPSAGHVFYGFSIPPLDPYGSVPNTLIRLQPTPDSPDLVWQFWGCELTFISQ